MKYEYIVIKFFQFLTHSNFYYYFHSKLLKSTITLDLVLYFLLNVLLPTTKYEDLVTNYREYNLTKQTHF